MTPDTPPDAYLSDAFIKSMHARMGVMEDNLQQNTVATQRNTDAIEVVRSNTQDLVDTFRALDGGFKVLRAIGRIARPIGWIAGAAAALITAWSAWKGLGK